MNVWSTGPRAGAFVCTVFGVERCMLDAAYDRNTKA